jgi:excisionase family DNA binding protein
LRNPQKYNQSRPCRMPARTSREQQQLEPAADMATELAKRKSALTAFEVALLLACSYEHVCKMAKQGRIPSYRINGMVRFDPFLLSVWLKSKSMGN